MLDGVLDGGLDGVSDGTGSAQDEDGDYDQMNLDDEGLLDDAFDLNTYLNDDDEVQRGLDTYAVNNVELTSQHALAEPQLRVAFLRNRTLAFAQAAGAVPTEPPHAYLLKYCDLCRVHWYDTVTHYRAVFAAGLLVNPVGKKVGSM